MNQTRFSKLSYVLLLFVLVACQAQVTSVPTRMPLPATAVLPTTAPTNAAVQDLTTFSPKTFKLPMSINLGSQWKIAEEYSDVVTLKYIGHDAGLSFMMVKNATVGSTPFPDDFIAWLQSPDSLFHVVDSKPVLVGGIKGIQINAIAACGKNANWIMLSGTGWGCPGTEHIGFIYLDDVLGERVLIQIQGSPDGKDYMFIVEESNKVLDTVVFSKP